jgi:putative transposase
LLKILELVRSYSVPIKDDRVSKLITWYVKALQNAIDMIWDNIEWRYCFQELVRKGKSWS